jgi:hypothetical protein
MTKQIRNSYSLQLLKNLEKNEQLLAPFNEKPPSGELKFLGSPVHSYNEILEENSMQNNVTQNSSVNIKDTRRLNLESATSSHVGDRKSIFDERDYNSEVESEELSNQTDNQSQNQPNFNTMNHSPNMKKVVFFLILILN